MPASARAADNLSRTILALKILLGPLGGRLQILDARRVRGGSSPQLSSLVCARAGDQHYGALTFHL